MNEAEEMGPRLSVCRHDLLLTMRRPSTLDGTEQGVWFPASWRGPSRAHPHKPHSRHRRAVASRYRTKHTKAAKSVMMANAYPVHRL
jgi:hypothetical protein